VTPLNKPGSLAHGTGLAVWEDILRKGLIPGGTRSGSRDTAFLSAIDPTTVNASVYKLPGARLGSDVFIIFDVDAIVSCPHVRLFRTSSDAYITSDIVPGTFITRVIVTTTGEALFERPYRQRVPPLPLSRLRVRSPSISGDVPAAKRPRVASPKVDQSAAVCNEGRGEIPTPTVEVTPTEGLTPTIDANEEDDTEDGAQAPVPAEGAAPVAGPWGASSCAAAVPPPAVTTTVCPGCGYSNILGILICVQCGTDQSHPDYALAASRASITALRGAGVRVFRQTGTWYRGPCRSVTGDARRRWHRALNRAHKLGFSSIAERFMNDPTENFTLSLEAEGWDANNIHEADVIANTPAQPKTQPAMPYVPRPAAPASSSAAAPPEEEESRFNAKWGGRW
jgi:hypothetical protein